MNAEPQNQSAFATAWNSELSSEYRAEMCEDWKNKYGNDVFIKDALCMDAVELADSLIAALNK
jgi:hypothetical protein